MLRAAGVVDHRREANWIYYRLAEQSDADRRRLLESVVAGFARRDVLRRDVARLRKVSGPGRCQ